MATQLELSPLLPNDPVKIGPYWLKARLLESESGIAFIGSNETEAENMIIQLKPESGLDPIAQAKLAVLISRMHADTVIALGGKGLADTRFQKRYWQAPRAPQEIPELPWVSLRYQGEPEAIAEAKRILSACDNLSDHALEADIGPDFQAQSMSSSRSWINRIWPLPWPNKYSRAGVLSILSSWLLMLLIMLVALVLAIIAFQHSAPVTAPKPIPSSQMGSSGSQAGSASPNSGSASPSNNNQPPKL